MKEGDEVEVKLISIERDGKLRLSRREILPLPEGEEGELAKARMRAAREGGGERRGGGDRGGDRGGRGGDRDRGRGPRR